MQGSLTGFSLNEVFKMLATMKKTGVLEINNDDEAFGRVGFKTGELYWAETSTEDGSKDPADRRGRPRERVEDAVFEIFGWTNSSYLFEAGAKLEHGGQSSFSVDALLVDVEKRQAEWAEILTKIPSMNARLALVDKLADESVSLSRDEWEIVALIGKSLTVEELRARLSCGRLAVCKMLYQMSKSGLVRCLGEVAEDEPKRRAEACIPSKSSEGKKYIRKGLLAEEISEDTVPAEWLSYYQLLDSRRSEHSKPAAKAREH